MSKHFIKGGKGVPQGASHPDDALPRNPTLDLPGSGDGPAMQDYMAGRTSNTGSPVGGAHVQTGTDKVVVSGKRVRKHG